MSEKNIFTIVEYEQDEVNGLNHVLELQMNGKQMYSLHQSPNLNAEQLESSRKVFMERVKLYVEDYNGILVRN